MGRQLKRVPLDFQWPENKVWSGYINPHSAKGHACKSCNGSGYSPVAERLKDQWFGRIPFKPEDRGSTPFLPKHTAIRALAARNVAWTSGIEREARRLSDHFNGAWLHHLNADDVAALVAGGRLMDFTHTWSPGTGWQPKEPPYVPTPEEVNLWSLCGMGHDSINCHVVVEAECKRLGFASTCPRCAGDGTLWDSPEDEQAYDTWKATEPPAGDGYQIWETVSEGSPISPVFMSATALAHYMVGRPRGADTGSSYESWMAFINGPGWAPSMVMDEHGIRTGPDAAKPLANSQP